MPRGRPPADPLIALRDRYEGRAARDFKIQWRGLSPKEAQRQTVRILQWYGWCWLKSLTLKSTASRIRYAGEVTSIEDFLVRTHMGLVLYVARSPGLRYRVARMRDTEVFDDLVQWGYVALLRAIRKFNPFYGVQFTTYAVQSIQQQIWRKAKETFGKLDVQLDNVDRPPFDSSWGDSKKNEIDVADLRAVWRRVDSILAQEEQYIIQERFGLGGQPRKTLKELGEILDVSKERIRQVQMKAIVKLRAELCNEDSAVLVG
jgi:RNA polymerase sigma factor (sigma-70 family)